MKKDGGSTLLRFTGRLALFVIAVSLMLPVTVTSSQTPPFVPGNSQGMFVVENALSQFVALKHHGEALGWVLPEHLGAPDPSIYDHYQGLVRYPGDGVPVFYVTQTDNDDPILCDTCDKGGYLHVVRSGTRPTTGERLRSNLLEKGKNTESTYPDALDTWVRSIRFDGSFTVDSARVITPPAGQYYTLPAYEHPGSMALVDDILFVPLDTPRQDDSPTGFIVLFDLSGYNQEGLKRREAPEPIHAIQLGHKIDNLAVTEQDDGTYLLWVNGDGGSVTKFYKTTSSNLRDDNLGLFEVQDWNPNSREDVSVPESCWNLGLNFCWGWDTGAHQSSTFLRQVDGSLYLIGMRHPGGMPDTGEDWADLYRVDPKPSEGFKLTLLFQLHLYCKYDGAGRICNFAAANNAYVSPSGELILYSIPHDDEDWADPDFVRLAEFRHRDVNYTGTCTRGTGWAELYDDKDFNDRSIVFDWADRNQDDFNNFNILDGFNDKTSSVRWCAPVECNIILYENSYYGGVPVTLPGTGGVIAGSDFGDFNDEVSSIMFLSDCTSGNSPPIADAGPDQFVSVGKDSTAIVALDGSASSDPDPDPLSYTWTWDGGSISGVRPTIRLSCGTTTVTLVVNDGMVNSLPDTVDIKVRGEAMPGIPLLLLDD